MQSKEEIEKFYEKPDPWNIQNNKDDIFRRKIIWKISEVFAEKFNPIRETFVKCLDIGCGEGWITQGLPAGMIHGLDVSENASKRVPKEVEIVTEAQGTYDLVCAFGIMYGQYDWKRFLSIMASHATSVIITCNIAEWEVDQFRNQDGMASFLFGKQIFSCEFPYRDWHQKLRVFQR